MKIFFVLGMTAALTACSHPLHNRYSPQVLYPDQDARLLDAGRLIHDSRISSQRNTPFYRPAYTPGPDPRLHPFPDPRSNPPHLRWNLNIHN